MCIYIMLIFHLGNANMEAFVLEANVFVKRGSLEMIAASI